MIIWTILLYIYTLGFQRIFIMRRQQEWQVTRNREARKNQAICPYCHGSHSKQEMSDGICPKMKEFALKQQKKYAYVCNKCQGQGSFQERVETKILQNAKKFEERWKIWMQNIENNQNKDKVPERRIIRTDLKSKEVICEQCEGQGNINRMIYKKDRQNVGRGMVSINYGITNQAVIVNPVWIKYRMKPRKASGAFHCSICLAQGGTLDKHFKLNCSHQFHYSCIFRWIKLNKKCPICRQVDPFIDIQHIEQDNSVQSVSNHTIRLNNQMRIVNQMLRHSGLRNEQININYYRQDHLIPSPSFNQSLDRDEISQESWIEEPENW